MPQPIPAATLPLRTRDQIRAQAQLLDGSLSRVALAAVDPDAVPAEDTGTFGELWLYGLVGGYWRGFNAESVAEALRGMDVDNLYVRIHSPGGSASDGIAIANLLRNHRSNVTVIVDGLAASAASVIALAGDTIVMCPGAQMMLHDASTGVYGNAAEIRVIADWIDGQSANYAGVYAYKAGGTPDQWREVMQANDGWGTWYTAEGAVTAGLADEVGTRTAVGSPPTAPDDDFDDDGWACAAHDVELLERLVHPAARATWLGEQRPKPPAASAEGSTTEGEGGPAVALSDAQITHLRNSLGLAEDADEATIVAAFDEALSERAESAPSVPDGMQLIETTVLDELRSGAQQGIEARNQQLAEARDAAIESAIADGRTTPARREHWATAWDADPEGARAQLEALAPGLVPVEERGHDQSTATGGAYEALYGNQQKGA